MSKKYYLERYLEELPQLTEYAHLITRDKLEYIEID